jgi:hypothetical protein
MKHDAGRDYLLFCDETGGSREGNVMCSIFLILLHLLSPNLIPFRVTGYFNDCRMQRGGGGGLISIMLAHGEIQAWNNEWCSLGS